MVAQKITLLTIVAVTISTVSAFAQWKITPDPSYGVEGVSVDASALPITQQTFEGIFVLDDGSAYTVRPGVVTDTTLLVGRMMKNGLPDPLFDLDGVLSLNLTSGAVDALLNPQELLWIGANRGARYELSEIDRLGRLRPTPLWQDTALYTTNSPISVKDDGTVVMWSQRWNPSDSPLYLRFTKVGGLVPSSDVFVPFQTEPVNLSLSTMFVDRNDRFLAGTNITQSSFAIARFDANGRLDETFGNAQGLLVIPVPSPGAAIEDVVSQQRGGYVIVLRLSERVDNVQTPYLRLLRIEDDGTVDVTFGTDGHVDIRGSRMSANGIVECPNGDLLLASTGSATTSHVYQIRSDGTLIPTQQGAFELVSTVQLLRIVDGRWLYGLSYDASTQRYAVSRFLLETVTSVDEQNHTPLDISIDHGVVSVKGASTPVTVSMYSMLGECVLRQECAPGATVAIPSTVSGAYVVSASTENASVNKIVSVVR